MGEIKDYNLQRNYLQEYTIKLTQGENDIIIRKRGILNDVASDIFMEEPTYTSKIIIGGRQEDFC